MYNEFQQNDTKVSEYAKTTSKMYKQKNKRHEKKGGGSSLLFGKVSVQRAEKSEGKN